MLALPHVSGAAFVLDAETLRRGCEAAAASSRRRIILPLHRSQDALVQRMLNFLQPETYIAPHLHPLPSASETIQVLQGAIGFMLFDATGEVLQTWRLEAGLLGLIDIEPDVWHGFVALEPDTVVLEIKRGPYSGAEDKVFAPWAPAEGAVGTLDAMAGWRALF